MGEDSLSLNVYTPVDPPAGPLPVMVYIYGGGYNNGAPEPATAHRASWWHNDSGTHPPGGPSQ